MAGLFIELGRNQRQKEAMVQLEAHDAIIVPVYNKCHRVSRQFCYRDLVTCPGWAGNNCLGRSSCVKAAANPFRPLPTTNLHEGALRME